MRLPVLAVLAWAAPAFAVEGSWKWQDAIVPDAGFGLDAAQVVRVTSLGAKGKGTLRDALKEKGPKIVVFEIGGVIDLEMHGIEVHEPQVYIAGVGRSSPPQSARKRHMALRIKKAA